MLSKSFGPATGFLEPRGAGTTAPASGWGPGLRNVPDRPMQVGNRTPQHRAGPETDMAPVHVILLAAGIGSRLGGVEPKPLTTLGVDGETAIERQLRLLAPLRADGCEFTVVVGHRATEFMVRLPDVSFSMNLAYASTNTARSLLAGLLDTATGSRDTAGALWLNTDVVFSESFAAATVAAVRSGRGSFVGVKRGRTAEEEVKYTLDPAGRVVRLSKQVQDGEGEAIGVNFVSAYDRDAFTDTLRDVGDHDYFEAGIEGSIRRGVRWTGLDLTPHFAVEVDFPADLEAARAYVASERTVLPVAV